MAGATRRTFIAGAATAFLARETAFAQASETGLGTLAARSGRFFGSALASDALTPERADYRAILETECSVWVPEWQIKWEALVRGNPQGPPDFSAADSIVSAALQQGRQVRGHALVWHEAIPQWAAGLSTPDDWNRFIAPHIRATAAHFGERIFQWDVVNEPIRPEDDGDDLMRRTPFYSMLGPDYVAESFHIAHEAAPKARLYLNEYDLCYVETWQERRRTGLLRLLERLLAAGVPLHGIGIQGHLNTAYTFREKTFADFIRSLEGMGLEIAMTEIDVREADNAGSASLDERRQRAADEVRKVVSVSLDSKATTGIVTWGLADSESWLRKTRPIPDNQGLPYDDRLQPTAMRAALAALFAAAPDRRKA